MSRLYQSKHKTTTKCLLKGAREMKVTDLKKMIKEKGLKQWQVAEFYGLNESNFSRLLRKDLPPEKGKKVIEAIEAAQVVYALKRS